MLFLNATLSGSKSPVCCIPEMITIKHPHQFPWLVVLFSSDVLPIPANNKAPLENKIQHLSDLR